MPNREQTLELIEKEFTAARAALAQGNDGRVRVCARRASGHAIAWFLAGERRTGWGSDAMRQLQQLRDDAEFPDGVRDAARRLTTKISVNFSYPDGADPLADANVIIRHLRSRMEGGDEGAH